MLYWFSVCDSNHYGEGCAFTCACNVNNTAMCDSVTGNCQCSTGWEGPTCDSDINECNSSKCKYMWKRHDRTQTNVLQKWLGNQTWLCSYHQSELFHLLHTHIFKGIYLLYIAVWFYTFKTYIFLVWLKFSMLWISGVNLNNYFNVLS